MVSYWRYYFSFHLPPLSRKVDPDDDNDINTNKYSYRHLWGYPKVGEIVILQSPVRERELVIKRVIALEGDTVLPRTNNNYATAAQPVTIPKGYLWIEGDNCNISNDSNSYGPVPVGLFRGVVTHIIWPPAKFASLTRQLPQHHLSSSPLLTPPSSSPISTSTSTSTVPQQR